jgi:competence protein ComEA
MKLICEPVKGWFGFTRRERRSTTILLGIIFVIIVLRYVLPEQNIRIEDYGVISTDTENIGEIPAEDISAEKSLFAFDPNSAPYDTLVKLGFTAREASTLIKYRSKGGKFRKPADIGKVYGVDSSKAEYLEAYVVISSGTSEKTEVFKPVQGKALININSCDSMALVALPGIGPVLSARIIKYRNMLGGFARVDQIREVYGLPEETYEKIKGRLFADSSGVRKIRINSSDFRELSRIPYLEKYEVTSILKFRELTGRVNSMEDLKINKILTHEKAEKVESYMDFR